VTLNSNNNVIEAKPEPKADETKNTEISNETTEESETKKEDK